MELLRVSEADTRNIFGRYSSQRMKVKRRMASLLPSVLTFAPFLFALFVFLFVCSKDWQEIVRRFQADNNYLGECSQIIQHK